MDWEVANAAGVFHEVRGMKVEFVFLKEVSVRAGYQSKHAFIGDYDFAGLLSARPFYLQRPVSAKQKSRFAVWYADECRQWVITADYRLLESMTVDARASDSAWFPWEIVPSTWEV